MSLRMGVAVAVSAAALSAAAAGAGVSALSVHSSLDGKTVVLHRVKWVATVRPAATPVKVFFLIDGKVRWVETKAPFVYGDDTGWLVTSWLRPGRHRFTVRAVASDGAKAESSTVATIAP